MDLIFAPYYYAINRRNVVDRYVLARFLTVLVFSFISLAGLYIVIDASSNVQEFSAYGERIKGGIAWVICEYYGARVFWFFDLTSGVIAMLAGIFAVTWMQRMNEMTALAAAGISPARIVQTLAVAAVGVAMLGIANREICLPTIRGKLAKNAQDWMGDNGKTCRPMFDMQSGILISGKFTFANEKRIESPQFSQLPPEFAAWGRQITADNAYYQPATNEHPGGYLLRKVRQPANLAELKSLSLGGQRVLFSPADTRWLGKEECFIASGVNFERLTVGTAWQQYLSTWELISGLHDKSLDYGASVRVTLHSRFVQPFLDISLFFLGIPLVLSRGNRNIFVAALLGLAVVGGFFGITFLSQWLGTNYLLPTALAAWLPLMIFGPLAYSLARPIWE